MIKIIAWLLLFTQCASLSWAKDFYVSPKGNDDNPGTVDQPFATITHARNCVQAWNTNDKNESITIWLNGGGYPLQETVVFGLKDSAKPGQTITYAAVPSEKPVISSDIFIAGWTRMTEVPIGLPDSAKGRIWMAKAPAILGGIKTLYNAGGALLRAKTGAIAHLKKTEGFGVTIETRTEISFKRKSTEKLFNPAGAEIVVIPAAPWTMNILPVKTVDHATGIVHLGAAATYALAAPRFYMGPEAIWVENTFAGLDQPGKWLFDADKRTIYYWPLHSEGPGDDIAAPALIEMIRVEGRIDYAGPVDVPVTGLTFKGLTFTHGERFDSAGQTGRGLQHDWERFDESTALLLLRGAEDCRVEECTFINSGGAGIRLDLHCQRIKIRNNELSELGGGGILLAGYGPGTKDVNRNNEIANNLIHHIGRLWWHSQGIWAWQSGHNLISHNTIHDVPYSAIAVTGRINWDEHGIKEASKTIRWSETGFFTGKESWEERERFLHGRENIIEENDIYRVMTVMQDGNGVYISGAGHGNVVRRNFIHDTPSSAAGEAIRCDDDQNETLIESNIVFRYGTHGIGICTKGRNHIFNNIVACPPGRVNRGMLSLEPKQGLSNAGSQILHNIFYATGPGQPFVSAAGLKKVAGTITMDRNIYFNTSDKTAADGYLDWAREQGLEKRSVQADPMFVDAEHGNFDLRPESPAFALGFRPFMLKAGRIGPASDHRETAATQPALQPWTSLFR
jgi:hypothetical protein